MDRHSRKIRTKAPGDISSSSSSATSTTNGMTNGRLLPSNPKKPTEPSTVPSSRGVGGTWAENYHRATVEDVQDSSGSSSKTYRKGRDRHVHFQPRKDDASGAARHRRRRPRDLQSWHPSCSSGSEDDSGINDDDDDDLCSTTSSDVLLFPSSSPRPIRSSLKKPRTRQVDKADEVSDTSTATQPVKHQPFPAPSYHQQTGYMLVPGPHPGTQQLVPVQVSTGSNQEYPQPTQPGYDAAGMGPAQLLSAQLQHLQLQQQGLYGMMAAQPLGGGNYYYPGAAAPMGYPSMQYPTCLNSSYPYPQMQMMQAPMHIQYPNHPQHHQQQQQQQQHHQQPMCPQSGYIVPGMAVPNVEPGGTPVQYAAENIPAFHAPGMHNMGGYVNN